LNTEKNIEELFDYCQILEAIIYPAGWDFLIKRFGIEKLFAINSKSGWLDCSSAEEYLKDIENYKQGS
jgi:hypothetical protein